MISLIFWRTMILELFPEFTRLMFWRLSNGWNHMNNESRKQNHITHYGIGSFPNEFSREWFSTMTSITANERQRMKRWQNERAKENPKWYSEVAIPNRIWIKSVRVRGFPFTNCFLDENSRKRFCLGQFIVHTHEHQVIRSLKFLHHDDANYWFTEMASRREMILVTEHHLHFPFKLQWTELGECSNSDEDCMLSSNLSASDRSPTPALHPTG
jgi:hypothetical protein